MARPATSLLAAAIIALMANEAGAGDDAVVTADTAADTAAKEADTVVRPLRVTGSSVVAPYALVAASLPNADAPGVFVEATGTSAGLDALCGAEAAPLAGASRAITPAELRQCAASGVATVIEAELGLGALSAVQAGGAAPLALTRTDLYLASAARVPDQDCRLTPNGARLWSDVRDGLPDRPIRLYGPPQTSGSRGVLVRTGLAPGARSLPCMARLERNDPAAFGAALALRRDGVWIDGGESDGALAFALTRLPDAVGLLGRVHVLAQDGLTELAIDGVAPTAETIAGGRYSLAGPLYLYTTADALVSDARVRPVLMAFAQPRATGPSGTLTAMGLTRHGGSGAVRLISTEDGTSTPLTLGR